MRLDFSSIAPYLKDPLVLIGFFLFLAFLFTRYILKKGIIPPLPQKTGYQALKTILLYGFLIGILVITLGFIIKYKELSGHKTSEVKDAIQQTLADKDLSQKEQDKITTIVEKGVKDQGLVRRSLSRIEAEKVLQKNRGNIQSCLADIKGVVFLNFLFTHEDGGISVDIYAGKEILQVPLWHTRLPKGVYTIKQLEQMLEKVNKELGQALFKEKPPADVDVRKRLYLIHGNTEEENPWDEHATIYVAEYGEKLSVISPKTNECLISILSDYIDGYSALPENKPFIHRFITDLGVKMSHPRKNH